MPPLDLSHFDLTTRILYRDASMLIIDKPAGLPVHAGPRGGPHLGALLGQLRFGLPRPPELAHRLDKDTSGCLVLGRHARALKTLGRLFTAGRVKKTYWAVVEGGPARDGGAIDMALDRRAPERGWWMRPDPKGKPAVTLFRVLARSDGLAWLELCPLTGRTHQLRVHCAASGFPILGDPIYGTAPRSVEPCLYLHAQSIEVPLYAKKTPVATHAPPPPPMMELLKSLRE